MKCWMLHRFLAQVSGFIKENSHYPDKCQSTLTITWLQWLHFSNDPTNTYPTCSVSENVATNGNRFLLFTDPTTKYVSVCIDQRLSVKRNTKSAIIINNDQNKQLFYQVVCRVVH